TVTAVRPQCQHGSVMTHPSRDLSTAFLSFPNATHRLSPCALCYSSILYEFEPVFVICSQTDLFHSKPVLGEHTHTHTHTHTHCRYTHTHTHTNTHTHTENN